MTFPAEPPTAPIVQPPTVPPPVHAPNGSSMPEANPTPIIRWGMGDVGIGLVLWVIGGIIGAIVLIATSGGEELALTDLSLGALTVSIVSGWFGFLGWPIVATVWKGQRSLRRDFGLALRPIDIGWGLLGGVVALALSAAGGILWALVSSEESPSNTEFLPTEPSAATALVVFLLVAVCTPIVEELFFRGLFLRSVGRRWNLTVGVLVTSAVFGLFHAQGESLGQMAFIVAVTAAYGAVFALLVVRAEGRLGPSIIAHMCVNSVGVLGALYL